MRLTNGIKSGSKQGFCRKAGHFPHFHAWARVSPKFCISPHDSAMKALIIYDDLATAVKANNALQHSALNSGFALQWNVNPWQIDMLKSFPTAEEALTDALDAHLIVIASPNEKSSASWFRGWLEHWAKCRQIKEAALALFGIGYADRLVAPAMDEFTKLARSHGLTLIFDDGRRGEDQSNFIEYSLQGQKLSASKPVIPISDKHVRHPYPSWGINE